MPSVKVNSEGGECAPEYEVCLPHSDKGRWVFRSSSCGVSSDTGRPRVRFRLRYKQGRGRSQMLETSLPLTAISALRSCRGLGTRPLTIGVVPAPVLSDCSTHHPTLAFNSSNLLWALAKATMFDVCSARLEARSALALKYSL